MYYSKVHLAGTWSLQAANKHTEDAFTFYPREGSASNTVRKLSAEQTSCAVWKATIREKEAHRPSSVSGEVFFSFFFFFNRKFRDLPTCFDCFENPMKPTESRGATSPSMDRHGNKTMLNQPFKLFSAKIKTTGTTWLVSLAVVVGCLETLFSCQVKKAGWQPEPRRSEVVI